MLRRLAVGSAGRGIPLARATERSMLAPDSDPMYLGSVS